MKITLDKLIIASQAFGILSGTAMKASISFKVKRLIKKANEELELFNKTREELMKEHNVSIVEDEKTGGQKFDIPKESREEWNKSMADLGATEVELDIDRIKASDLDDVVIAPNVLLALDEIIVED